MKKTRQENLGQFVRQNIREGKTNHEILASVLVRYPKSKFTEVNLEETRTLLSDAKIYQNWYEKNYHC